MKLLHKALLEGSFLLRLEAQDLEAVFRAALDLLVARRLLPAERHEDVLHTLLEREAQGSTAIGHAVAVPHAYLDVLSEPAIVFVRLARPLNLGAPDGIPTRFFFLLLGPPGRAVEHLDTLTNIARLMSDEEFRHDATTARSQLDLIAALERFRQRTAPERPHRKPVEDGLQFFRTPLAGLAADLRRRLPQYAGDLRDGLHTKVLASILFLFFACLAPTVTFGGVLDALTYGQIGVVETLLATGLGAAAYALLAGQPLTIVATTGPIAVFLGVLAEFCRQYELAFLPALAWIGLWTALFVLLIVVLNATAVMRLCTRFTDEIFAALIVLIYLTQAVQALVAMVLDQPRLNDTALLSLLLALGTFFLALNLSRFRRSRYLLATIREFLADFGPALALAAMTIVAVALRDQIPLSGLHVRSGFATTAARPWLVDLFDSPVWFRWAAAGPALFATVLVFLDQNITVRLVNSPDNRLRKGPGYHWDLAVIGLLTGIFSLFGLPWVVAATVRSLNHVRSLATVEEVVTADGQSRDRIISVRENRVSGAAIGLLIALSLFLTPVLKLIPLAALFGLLLYMGVVSTAGNQFFERLKLWLTDPALYPSTHYIRRVPTGVVHAYTLLQLACLAVLWLVKASAWGILFPLLIALLVPVRLLAGRLFAPAHLAALDAEEDPEEEETHWM